MKLYQGTAPAVGYRDGKLLYEFNDRWLETDDADLIALLLSLGAYEYRNDPPPPQDLDEVIERLGVMDGRVSSLESKSGDYVKTADMIPITEAEVDEITAN